MENNISAVNTTNNPNTTSYLPEEYPMQENSEDISLFFETQQQSQNQEAASVEEPEEIGLFSDRIGLDTQYFSGDDYPLPFVLTQPIGNDPNNPKPLIVFLHGDSQKENQETTMYWPNTLSGIMTEDANWDLDNFNGYVLCPVSEKGWGDEQGNDSRYLLSELLDKFMQEHNISKVIGVGASSGAISMMDIMKEEWGQYYFDEGLIISAPNQNTDGIEKPMYGAVGNQDNIAFKNMKQVFGDDLIIVDGADHTTVVNDLFRQDNNGNNVSDILELMFEENEED